MHDTPQSNGVAERLNRMLMERICAMGHESGLPQNLWGEALAHVVWVKNRTASQVLDGKMPYELLCGKKPNLMKVPTWGARVWVHDPNGSKLDTRACEGRWVGFDAESRAHRIDRDGQVTVERNVSFERREDEVLGPQMPQIEGEGRKQSDQHIDQMKQGLPMQPEALPNPNQTSKVTSTAPDPPAPPPKVQAPEPPPRRSTQQRTESTYMRMLRDGVGTHDGRGGDPVIPRGLQPVEECRENRGENAATEADMADGAWEWDDEDAAYAMLVRTSKAEALEPWTVDEAQKQPNWPRWDEAIRAELKSLDDAHTWDRVPRPPKPTNVVDCKWVFKIKKNSAGEIDKYKARLVARGFTQIHGVDYYETYAPVARLASLRLVLAAAAHHDWPIDVFDFHSAFLNRKLDDNEVIYMELPPGFDKRGRDLVACLQVALYGSKQGALKWYQRLCRELAELGFRCTEADWGVFVAKIGAHLLILASHVDDCTITGSSNELVKSFKDKIGSRFKITDLGPISWLLGMKVTCDRDARTISISQEPYIDALLAKYNFTDVKLVSIPMVPNIQLSRNQSPKSAVEVAKMRQVPFRAALGSLMYLAVGTRPDIAFVISTLVQFTENPGWTHWEALKRVYRYLIGMKTWSLTYGTESKGLEGYTDADGASQEHRHAISGYAFLIDGAAISWGSRKQELVTLSTTEAEYVAATHGAKEAIWLRQLIGEIFKPLEHPTTIHCDNQSAITLTKDGNYHAQTKHIDIHYHFIHYSVSNNSIHLIYCPTDNMIADTLMKALPSIKAKHFAFALRLRSV
jgi:hypothetical protein